MNQKSAEERIADALEAIAIEMKEIKLYTSNISHSLSANNEDGKTLTEIVADIGRSIDWMSKFSEVSYVALSQAGGSLELLADQGALKQK